MKKAIVVAGLTYGDEGKGATVDFLTRRLNAKLVVRYNGGPQAAHNVVTPNGTHHTFSQFGSGTLADPTLCTLLSRWMLINPLNMIIEAGVLEQKGITKPLASIAVSNKCLVITPFQAFLNKVRIKTSCSYNSCGQGIGVCREHYFKYEDEVLFAEDLLDTGVARKKLRFLRDVCYEEARDLDNCFWMVRDYCIDNTLSFYRQWSKQVTFGEDEELLDGFHDDVVIFEGAQGVLLDEKYGEDGYNTWTNCTFENALELLRGTSAEVYKLGVLRTYLTRHGSGPLPTEDKLDFQEFHNSNYGYQGNFRRGRFDVKTIHKAFKIAGGVDSVALNHWDQCAPIPGFEDKVGVKISIIGAGPAATNRHATLEWSQ